MRWTEAVVARVAESQPSGRSLVLVLAAVNAASVALLLAGGRIEAGTVVDAVVGWCPVPVPGVR